MARRAKSPAPDADKSASQESIPSIDISGFGVEDDDEQNLGDVLVYEPLKLRAMQAKGIDTIVTRCRIERWRNDGNGKTRLPGEFPPDQVTVAWLRTKFGPGRYTVRGCNQRGSYIAHGTCTIGADEPGDPSVVSAPPVNGHGLPLPASAPDSPLAERLLLAILPALLQNRAAPQDDSLREVMSVMGRMTAMQLQIQAANMLKNPAATTEQKDRTVELLKTILESQSKPPPPPPKQMGLAEFFPILQLGMNMGARMNGGPNSNPEKQLPPWLEVMPSLVDTVGVPLIATIAQGILPPEKAKLVLDAINEHSNARRAEAEAEVAASGEPEVEP